MSMHLAPSTSNCAVSTGPIHATLVVQGSLTQTETTVLCYARDRCFAGMLRHCHRVCMQKASSQQGWFGWGSGKNSAHNSSHVHVHVQTSQCSLHLESLPVAKKIKRHSWAGRSATHSHPRDFNSGLHTYCISPMHHRSNLDIIMT